MSDSLWPHGLQHTRLPCPSPVTGAYSNSCPLSRWCHPTISPSVVPFSCLQSFPASGLCPVSQFFVSGGQSIGVSASASVLPMNIQDWFPLEWTGWISLQSKDSQQSSPRPQFESINSNSENYCKINHKISTKASVLWHSAFFIVQLSHPYMTTAKNIVWTRQTFVGKVMSLLFNMLSMLVITFLPRKSIF